jgi:hypothetical protein
MGLANSGRVRKIAAASIAAGDGERDQGWARGRLGDWRAMRSVDHFQVRRISLKHKYLYVDVFVARDFKACVSGRLCDKKTKQSDARAVFCPSPEAKFFDGRIGQIRVPLCSKLELYALHESIHAAFEASLYLNFRRAETREEFIARCAEYIFTEIQKRFRAKHYYKK